MSYYVFLFPLTLDVYFLAGEIFAPFLSLLGSILIFARTLIDTPSLLGTLSQPLLWKDRRRHNGLFLLLQLKFLSPRVLSFDPHLGEAEFFFLSRNKL